MNKKYSLFLCFLILTQFPIIVVGQTCLPNGITFTTQVQIDSFQTNYPNCTEIEGNVSIYAANIMNLYGLNTITRINGNLWVSNAYSLINFNGLNNLCEIGGQLTVGYYGPYSNYSIESFTGLERLKKIGGSFTIVANQKLEDFTGLDSLRSVHTLDIGYNESLISLYGLVHLDSIYNGVIISGTEQLIDLSGISNLTYIKHYIHINGNDSLISLTGLDNLSPNSVNAFLRIIDNPVLSQCEAESICEIIADTNVTKYINNNSEGCNNQEEILQACTVGLNNTNVFSNNISISPNPATDIIKIDNYSGLNILEINIYCLSGNLILNKDYNSKLLNISTLKPGIYIIEFNTKDFATRSKIIKL